MGSVGKAPVGTSCTWDAMAAALDRTAAAEDGRWAFAYPDGWEVARKPLKTHFQVRDGFFG